MRIAISGASGFIGTSLKHDLFLGKAQFVPLLRNDSDEQWAKIIQNSDVVINLAGASVSQRWTKKNKRKILRSRVITTHRIVSILNSFNCRPHPKLFISASAIGIYPNNDNVIHSETSNKTGDNFLAYVVKQWEKEALELSNPNIRLIIPRIGVVMGKQGGLLKKLFPLFKLGLGGPLASGKQAMSYIHIRDLTRAFQYFIDNQKTKGVYNLVSPNVCTNNEFSSVLGRVLNRPVLFWIPAFVLRMVFGKTADIMIYGEKVYPERILQSGFGFKYQTINETLLNIFK